MKFTFRPYKGGKSPAKDVQEEIQNPQLKRKEQVRRAQKTHRERKEAYTKSLETEVVQLRSNESKLYQETKRLYAELNSLKRLLAEHNIPIPESSVPPLAEEVVLDSRNIGQPYTLTIPEKKDKTRAQRIYVQPNSDDDIQSQTSGQAPSSRSQISSSLSPSPGPATVLPTSSPHLGGSKRLGELDSTAVGMDFVLSLESPCFDHINGEPGGDAAAPTGHALTASATLLHQCSHDSSHQSQSHRTWQVSSSGIDQLLQLSYQIPLDGEVTPVQAWDHIRKHEQYQGLELERMEKLKKALVAQVKCYGFGAVIEQGAFENAVFEAFVVGRVF